MVMIDVCTYPLESTEEMVKRFKKLPPVPDYISIKGHYIRHVEKDGVQSILIYEFDADRYAEASEHISKRWMAFYGVPGFTGSSQPWLEAVEAIKLLQEMQ